MPHSVIDQTHREKIQAGGFILAENTPAGGFRMIRVQHRWLA